MAEPDAAELAADARAAQEGMARWLSLVPQPDVQRAASLYAAVRAADADRDGKLSPLELESMPESVRALWKARVAYVGQ